MKILWIPHTSWRTPQRAHLFCHALAERHTVHVTDWVADFTSLRDYLSRRYLRNFTYRRYRDGAITVHGIPRVSPALFVPALRRLNAAVFSAVVKRIVAQYSIDAVVGTFVVPPPTAPRLVFDLFDDNPALWRSSGRWAKYADEIEQIERSYLQAADAVVAASSVLTDKAHAPGTRGPVYFIPNGIDLRRFKNTDGVAIRTQLEVQGPLVGTVGNYDRPAELDKVLDAANICSNSDITFLIAGRGTAMPGAQERVQRERLTNVKFMGYVPPDKAADTISALDVGLCPYSKTPGDEARSPMRLLMYAAAGLPIVCTDLEEVRRMQFPNVVLVDDTAESLAEGIKRALQLPRGQPPQVKEFDLPRLIRRYEAVLNGTIE